MGGGEDWTHPSPGSEPRPTSPVTGREDVCRPSSHRPSRPEGPAEACPGRPDVVSGLPSRSSPVRRGGGGGSRV